MGMGLHVDLALLVHMHVCNMYIETLYGVFYMYIQGNNIKLFLTQCSSQDISNHKLGFTRQGQAICGETCISRSSDLWKMNT